MLPISYYTSSLNVDCQWAAVGRVIVAMYFPNRGWIVEGIFRPTRHFYKPLPWSGEAFDIKLLDQPIDRHKELQFVEEHGIEVPPDLWEEMYQ